MSTTGDSTSVDPSSPTGPVRAKRRWSVFALGVALIALMSLGIAWALNNASQTQQVLAVTNHVARGEQITATDLVAVPLPVGPSALAPIAADQLDTVVGQLAAVDLLPGTTLTAESVSTSLGPAPGHSVVGIALEPRQMPSTPLRAGDRVRIIDTPVMQGEPPVEPPGEIEATVVQVRPVGDGTQRIVDLEVPASDAPGLAARAFTGRVALVLDNAEG